jgi:hypothetical protein
MDTKYPYCTVKRRFAQFGKLLSFIHLRILGHAELHKFALGLDLDTHPGVPNQTKRSSDRSSLVLPARLTWKDQRGTTRFAAVVTRNVSEQGVYVECQSPVSIPLYRLVQFQLERDARSAEAIPATLLQGRVLSAVYRVSPASASTRQGLALRLMVDPRRVSAAPVSANTAQVLAS